MQMEALFAEKWEELESVARLAFSIEMSKSGIGSVEGKRIHDIAEFLPLARHIADVFRFVPKNDPIAHLRCLCAEALERRERIGMIFVTENGMEEEALLGILTVWDVAGVVNVTKQ